MKKTKLAKAIAFAIAGTALTAGAVSTASAGQVNYNAFNHDRSAPNFLVGGTGTNPPGLAGTDGWMRTDEYWYDADNSGDQNAGDTIYPPGHSWADGPAAGNNRNNGAAIQWVGIDPRSSVGSGGFGYGPTIANRQTPTVNWSATIGANDSATVSNVDSNTRYGDNGGTQTATTLADGTTFNYADIDTAKGAWFDDAPDPNATGWRHDTDIGLFRSAVTQNVKVSIKSLGPENLNAKYGITVFQGMTGNTTGAYNHHAGWHAVSIAAANGAQGSGPSEPGGVDITTPNPFGGSGLSLVLDDVLNNDAGFTAYAGQIYTIYVGGFRGGNWTVTRDNYEVIISSDTVPPNVDYGDAPDGDVGTAPGNYQTTAADGGPSHIISPTLYLGTVVPDLDGGTLQDGSASQDDSNSAPGGPDDEDGIPLAEIPTFTTTATSTKMKVTVTNNTGSAATLACWADLNRNGDFENTSGVNGERATATIAPGIQTPTLSYSYSPLGTTGNIYIRCRVAANPAEVADSIGAAATGEVEDYVAKILEPCATSAITTVEASGSQLSGITFSVSPGAPIVNIKSIQCKKMVNILPTGMSFSPVPNTGPGSAPFTWSYTNPVNSAVQVTARRAAAGSATLGCTVTDFPPAPQASHECAMDPVIVEILRVKGEPRTMRILDDGKPLSVDFQYVKIINGSATEPGLRELVFKVNGQKFEQPLNGVKGSYFLNIGSALRSDKPNNITVTAKGKPGGMASVFFSDEPLL